MLEDSGFELMLANLPDYERLVAEIYFDGKFVALVSEEGAPGNFRVEMPGPDVVESLVTRTVDLDGFTSALRSAVQTLSDGR